MCFDEWNVWDPQRARGDLGAEETYTLSDALAVAVWLNVFVRQSKHVGMANIAQSVNVISPLMTTKDGLYKQTIWWPLYLFSRFMRGWTVACHVRSGSYKGVTRPDWLQGVLEEGAPWLDVSASVDDEGHGTLVAVNISDAADLDTEVRGVHGDVSVYTVSGPRLDAVNEAGKDEQVGIKESKWDGKGRYVFPKHSMTLFRWRATGPETTVLARAVPDSA